MCRACRLGRSFVEDVSDQVLGWALASGRYAAAAEPSALSGFDFALITVPTPLHEATPDLSFIEASARAIGGHLRPGATVVLESTTYPGTTQEFLAPALEAASGLTAGTDFHLGYSPERIDPGNEWHTFVSTPKVVAGIDEGSSKAIADLYERLVDTIVPVSTPKEAELTKLLENTFRHVNIALINELAIFAQDLEIDIWEVIDAASTKPFGFMRFTPGPGVGGHCLPVDPSYLSWQVRRTLGKAFRFVELANDVNEHMPDYVVQRVMAGLNAQRKALNGSRCLLIGLSYKKNVGDPRESPALKVAELLQAYGATVIAADPYVESHLLPPTLTRVDLSQQEVSRADAVVILTDHDAFDYEMVAEADAFVLDTRNRLDGRREALLNLDDLKIIANFYFP